MNIFTRTPTNVDEALAGVTRALADLQTVEQAKVAEAESHAAAAETALQAQAAATAEAERAARVRTNIGELLL